MSLHLQMQLNFFDCLSTTDDFSNFQEYEMRPTLAVLKIEKNAFSIREYSVSLFQSL